MDISTLIINSDVIKKVENKIETYDLISLVFLLYTDQDSAFQKILLLQRAGKTTSLLEPWFLEANSRSTWKHEFLQALSTCQLYGVIRNLGLNVATVKQHYHPDNAIYLNLPKIKLYHLCENINSDNLKTLKDKLYAQNIDTSEYETCELILLKLMNINFIVIVDENKTCDLENLLSIVEELSGMRDSANILRELQSNTMKQSITSDVSNSEEFYDANQSGSTDISDESMWDPTELSAEDIAMIDLIEQSVTSGNLVKTALDLTESKCVDTESASKNESKFNEKERPNSKDVDSGGFYAYHFAEEFQMLEQCFTELMFQNSKADKPKKDLKNCTLDRYPIKNPNRVGFCFIINQKDFQPAKNVVLDPRTGSDEDVKSLHYTMRCLKFETYHVENLSREKMLWIIKYVIWNKVLDDDSIFMLCVLSHGVQGSVYASDAVLVEVNEIQNTIGDELRGRNLNIPKLIVIQACQVVNAPILVPDTPLTSKIRARKSDFLICWATAPQLIAYRRVYPNGEGYSIFIEKFCKNVLLYARSHHLLDILVKVNNDVAELCDSLTCDQVSKFDCYLIKDLYLQIPTRK